MRPTGASGCVRLGTRFNRCVSSASSRRSRSSSSATSDFKRLPSSMRADRLSRLALPAGGLGHLVLPAADLLDGLEQAPALVLKRDHAIDVLDHVGRDVPVAAVLFDRLGVGDDEFQIKHGNTLLAWGTRWSLETDHSVWIAEPTSSGEQCPGRSVVRPSLDWAQSIDSVASSRAGGRWP